MTPTHALWADNIKFQRELRDWTKTELAARLGVSVPAICYWETGKRVPKDDHKLAIAALFNIPVRTLFPLIDRDAA